MIFRKILTTLLIFISGSALAEAYRWPDASNMLALKEFVSASAYGFSTSASGTVNKTALESAITAAAHKTLVIPSGTFTVTYTNSTDGKKIGIDDTVRIVGAGMDKTIIKLGNDYPSFAITMFQADDSCVVIFEDLTIEGPTNPSSIDSMNASYLTCGIGNNGSGFTKCTKLFLNRVKLGKNLKQGVGTIHEVFVDNCEFWTDDLSIGFWGDDPNDRIIIRNTLFERAAGKDSPTGDDRGAHLYLHPGRSAIIEGCVFKRSDRYPTYPGRNTIQWYGSSSTYTGAMRSLRACYFDSTVGPVLTGGGNGKTNISDCWFYNDLYIAEETNIENSHFIGSATTGAYLATYNLSTGELYDGLGRVININNCNFENYFIQCTDFYTTTWKWHEINIRNSIMRADSSNVVCMIGIISSNVLADSARATLNLDNSTFESDGTVQILNATYYADVHANNSTFRCTGTNSTGSALMTAGTGTYYARKFEINNSKFLTSDTSNIMSRAFNGYGNYIEGKIVAGNDYFTRTNHGMIGYSIADRTDPDTISSASSVCISLKYNTYYLKDSTTVNGIYHESFTNYLNGVGHGYLGDLYFYLTDSAKFGVSGNIVPKLTTRRSPNTIVHFKKMKKTNGTAFTNYAWFEL